MTAQTYAFSVLPESLTVAQLPTVASQTTTLPLPTNLGPGGIPHGGQLRVVNRNTQDVFMAFGQGAAVTCTVPTVGTNANGLIVLAGEDMVITPPLGTDRVATAQLSAGSGNIYFTVGEGL
jgi:hypothetical protein